VSNLLIADVSGLPRHPAAAAQDNHHAHAVGINLPGLGKRLASMPVRLTTDRRRTSAVRPTFRGTVSSSSPLNRLILVNPGPLPEIRLLAEVSRGLDEVRSVVDRETMGAVSPSTQQLAVDSLMQVHHNAIGRTLRAANKRSGRLLFAPDDALQLVVSHITHASTATYWLRLARGFRRIPRKDGQRSFEGSTAKSRELREIGSLKSDSSKLLPQTVAQWFGEQSPCPVIGVSHARRVTKRKPLRATVTLHGQHWPAWRRGRSQCHLARSCGATMAS
jgi:hypothetical protein